MNNRFKFRAWNDEEKVMPYFSLYSSCLQETIFKDFDMFSKQTTMQCSGLPDKNGKLIFEKDIVKTSHRNCRMAKVLFEGGSYVVDRKDCPRLRDNLLSSLLLLYSVEVIGNIHENPELMEVLE